MSTLTFTQALLQAEAQARSTLDVALAERLSCAVSLVRDGAVFQRSDGSWEVDSSTREGITYAVNGVCSCDDVHYNKPPQGLCKHRIAVGLAKRAQQLLAQPPAPVVPPAPPVVDPGLEVWPDNDVEVWPEPATVPQMPSAVAPTLPEAPVSITLKGLLHGQDVMVTLRGVDFASVKAQVEEAAQWLQAQAPQPAQPPQSGPTPPAPEKRYCPLHGSELRWNEGREGRKGWYSHKTADGQWCKGK